MVLQLHARNIAWSIENPASSLMWITTPFVHLLQAIPSLIAFSFHTCMFAASRKKDTALWTSIPDLRRHLERKCDGNHEHLKGGKLQQASLQQKNVHTMTHCVQLGQKEFSTSPFHRASSLLQQQLAKCRLLQHMQPMLTKQI